MKFNFLIPNYKVKLTRLGSNFDGGYLIPTEFIKKTETLLSFGLNDDWSFENDFKIKNNKLKIYSYDHTVNRKFWYEYTILSIFYFIKNFKNLLKIFKYINYYFFFQKKLKNFHIKKKIVKIKNNLNEISIDEIILQFKDKIFIKIDIENDEYRILNSLKKFKQLLGFVIEFHYVDLNFKIIRNFLKKNKNFKIVHVHPNNMGGVDSIGFPTTLEITFINLKFCKDRKKISLKKFKKHLFDKPNDPKKKDIVIRSL